MRWTDGLSESSHKMAKDHKKMKTNISANNENRK